MFNLGSERGPGNLHGRVPLRRPSPGFIRFAGWAASFGKMKCCPMQNEQHSIPKAADHEDDEPPEMDGRRETLPEIPTDRIFSEAEIQTY